MINEIFYELIHVALGTQTSLSRLPKADEWDEMFAIAKKQSLVGITFIGLQKLGADADEGFARIGMSEDLYFTWVGVAAKINVQNEIVNVQCSKVQEELHKAGFDCCILKGQGVAAYYGDLSAYRQSGDIDVWVPGSTIPQLVEYVKGLGAEYTVTYAHVSFKPFEDTEVELHPRPAFLRNFWNNRKLQKWLRVEGLGLREYNSTLGFTTPTVEFNVVYLLLHMYHHVVYEGVGLRQMMDYFFVLKTLSNSPLKGEDLTRTIASFGLKKFAQGVMWIMQEVFGLDEDKLLFEADAKIGQLLLNEIMEGGNFGRYDKRDEKLKSKGLFGNGWRNLKKKSRYISFAFWDIVCSPFWSVWQITWRKYHRYC